MCYEASKWYTTHKHTRTHARSHARMHMHTHTHVQYVPPKTFCFLFIQWNGPLRSISGSRFVCFSFTICSHFVQRPCAFFVRFKSVSCSSRIRHQLARDGLCFYRASTKDTLSLAVKRKTECLTVALHCGYS